MIGQTISHYKILSKLGEGGMGVVYKAYDTKLKRPVALKFLASHLLADEQQRKRFIHEAQAAASLTHSRICTVYEVDEADGHTFMVMEYIEGESLKERIESGPLEVAEALEIAIQVGRGLSKAHGQGIVHRDIKPGNVLLTGEGDAKIVDFGLAKLAAQTRLTKTGATVGTVMYMSPEQAKGDEVDHRTDIWSLGVMLYEMLTGKLPFKGDVEPALVYSIVNQDPEPVTSSRKDVPVGLEVVIEKALAKRPEKRYPRVSDLLADLESERDRLSLGIKRDRFEAERSLRKKRIILYGAVAGAVVVLIATALGIRFFAAPSAAIGSIAVLPLVNLSDDPKQEYFADGMTEALISEVGRVGALRVISPTSVARYKNNADVPLPEIARELNVDAVLRGSTMHVSDQVRISVQLYRGRPEKLLWSDSYVRDARDVLVLMSELTRAIADEINVELTQSEKTLLAQAPPVEPQAWDAYLKGRSHLKDPSSEGVLRAIDEFKNATRIDSTCAAAYAGLSEAYMFCAWTFASMPMGEAFAGAEAAALKALELDETLDEAHSSLAVVRWNFYWDWQGAEDGFKRAVELNPSCAPAYQWYSGLLFQQGRIDESIAAIERAHALDPLSLHVAASIGYPYYAARRYEEALKHFRKVRSLDPSFALVRFNLGFTFGAMGMLDSAVVELEKTVSLEPNDVSYQALLAFYYAKDGQEAEAEQILKTLIDRRDAKQDVPALYIATVYTGQGRIDRAFEWMDSAFAERNPVLTNLSVTAEFDPLRSDPRFTALLKRIGLEK